MRPDIQLTPEGNCSPSAAYTFGGTDHPNG